MSLPAGEPHQPGTAGRAWARLTLPTGSYRPIGRDQEGGFLAVPVSAESLEIQIHLEIAEGAFCMSVHHIHIDVQPFRDSAHIMRRSRLPLVCVQTCSPGCKAHEQLHALCTAQGTPLRSDIPDRHLDRSIPVVDR